MTQIKIALVGTDTMSRQKITRELKLHYGFSNFNMLDGVRRCTQVLYGRMYSYRNLHATVKWRMYNALYAIDNDIFLRYLDQRVPKTTKHIVITDPHYIHEVKELEKRGFIIIRVVPEGKQRKSAKYIMDASPGTVSLYEWFPNVSQGYKPYYQILYTTDNARNMEMIKSMVDTLKLKTESMYNKLEPQYREDQHIEEEVSTSDKIND